MKIDLHCHSKYSHDTYFDPAALIRQAQQIGLDGVCFTEHFSVDTSMAVEKINVHDGFRVFRGVEISTAWGHLLVYGLKDDVWNRWGRDHYLDVENVIRAVHELGGICAPAHPFREWSSFGKRVFDLEGLDAVETHNGRNTASENHQALMAAQALGLPCIGGSDCHRKDQVGLGYTRFENRVSNMDELVAEIRAGRCCGVVAAGDRSG